jgi:hypothetical protein
MRNADLSSPAVLVRFAPLQGDHDALGHPLDICAVDCTKFRPPESASEADQEKRSVATVPRTVAEGRQHGQNVGFEQRPGAGVGRVGDGCLSWS